MSKPVDIDMVQKWRIVIKMIAICWQEERGVYTGLHGEGHNNKGKQNDENS